MISSLFLIDNLTQYIQFIHTNLPSLASSPDLTTSLTDVVSHIFVVYTEMRNISFAFDEILRHQNIAALASLYTHTRIQTCLQEQVTKILPLQIHDILKNLLPYVLASE